MKARFQADWEVSSEELFFLSLMSKNSVLEELRVRRLAVGFSRFSNALKILAFSFHFIQSSRKRCVEERFEGEKCLSQSSVSGSRRRAECHLHEGGGQGKGKRSVYMMKCRGPRTEPWATPQEEV